MTQRSVDKNDQNITPLQRRVLDQIQNSAEGLGQFENRVAEVVRELLDGQTRNEDRIVGLVEAIAPGVSPTAPRETMRALMGGKGEEGEKAVALLQQLFRLLDECATTDEVIRDVQESLRKRLEELRLVKDRTPHIENRAAPRHMAGGRRAG